MNRSPRSHQVPVSTIALAPRLLAEASIDHREVAAMAGIEPGHLAAPEGRISFEAMGRYLQACVLAAGDEAFALRVGLAGVPGALARPARGACRPGPAPDSAG